MFKKWAFNLTALSNSGARATPQPTGNGGLARLRHTYHTVRCARRDVEPTIHRERQRRSKDIHGNVAGGSSSITRFR